MLIDGIKNFIPELKSQQLIKYELVLYKILFSFNPLFKFTNLAIQLNHSENSLNVLINF